MALDDDAPTVLGPAALTEPQLVAWGERIGAETTLPLVLALRGPLGAGKSVLARAVARGAGVVGPMPSPTFNLVYRYPAARGADVWHLDLYRLEDPDDVWELGWRELGEGAQLVLIEWPERAESLLPGDRWDIYLELPGSGSDRAGAGNGKAQAEARWGGMGSGDVPAHDAIPVRIVRAVRRGEVPGLPALPGGER